MSGQHCSDRGGAVEPPQDADRIGRCVVKEQPMGRLSADLHDVIVPGRPR